MLPDETGKSYAASLLAAKSLLEGKNVFLFAQTFAALKDNLMKETKKRLLEMLGDRFKYNGNAMTIEFNGKTIFGFSYENIEATRGYTDISVAIFDEAALAPSNIIETCVPCLRGEGIIPQLYFTTTPRANSWLTRYIKDHDVEIIRATTFDNTHLSKESIDLMKASITNEDMIRQELYGEEIELVANAIVQLKDFSKVINKSLDPKLYYIGIDMSGTGGDTSCVVIRNSQQILYKKQWSTVRNSDVAAWIEARINELGIRNLVKIRCDMAYGSGVIELLERKYDAELVSFAGKPEQEEYANNRAAMYFKLAQAIRDGFFIDDDTIKEELTNITYQLNNRDKLLLDGKDILRDIIGRSPDSSDALALTFLEDDLEVIGASSDPNRYETVEETQEYFNTWLSGAF